jgi:sec-independent protein translocase protein TatA
MFGIGWQEILLILVIVLLLFGARRIPEVMKSLGKGVREFKKGIKEVTGEDDEQAKKPDDKSAPPQA